MHPSNTRRNIDLRVGCAEHIASFRKQLNLEYHSNYYIDMLQYLGMTAPYTGSIRQYWCPEFVQKLEMLMGPHGFTIYKMWLIKNEISG